MVSSKSIIGTNYLDYDFLKKDNLKNAEMEFSLLSGYNFYQTSRCEEEKTYLGIHVQTNTLVRIMRIGITDQPISQIQINWHQKFIQKTMQQEYFEWPIDLVEYEYAERKYVQCYVFPLKAYPEFVPIKKLLYQDKTSKRLDWRNREIKNIIRSLLKVFSNLHENNFSYNDFDMDRIFYDEKSGKIFLRYNQSIQITLERNGKYYIEGEMKEGEGQKDSIRRLYMVDVKKISTEFAPSYMYQQEMFLGNIDEYSISSLLFRLMIGRMPYEGKALTSFGDVLDPVRDTDQHVHQYYFEHYHQYPLFIFDLEDDSNSMGPMSENDLPRERWDTLPQEIKEMFYNSLGCMQEGKRNKMVLYSPKRWLEELNRWCWNDDIGRDERDNARSKANI